MGRQRIDKDAERKPRTARRRLREKLQEAEDGDEIKGRKTIQFERQTSSKEDGDLGPRQIRFIASTATEDRDGDVIAPEGIVLDNFKQNGPFHAFHRTREEPIGRVVESYIEDGKMVAVVEFLDPADMPDDDPVAKRAERIFRLYKLKFMNAVSIGFIARPENVEEREQGGFHFELIEVIELSAVSVPSNPDALVDERAHGDGTVERMAKAMARAMKGEVAPELERSFEKQGRTLRSDVAERIAMIRFLSDDVLSEEGFDEGVPNPEEMSFSGLDEDDGMGEEDGGPEGTPPDNTDRSPEDADLDELFDEMGNDLRAIVNNAQTIRQSKGEGDLIEDCLRLRDAAQAVAAKLPSEEDTPAPETKAITEKLDLPLASRDKEWDASAADGRWREFSGSEDEPSEDYWENFIYHDPESAGNFSAYKLPYGDVVDDAHVAVPRGVFAVAAALEGARGGVDIPDDEVDEAQNVVEEWYGAMREEFDDDGIIAPWNTEDDLSSWFRRQADTFGFEDAEAATKWLVSTLNALGFDDARDKAEAIGVSLDKGDEQNESDDPDVDEAETEDGDKSPFYEIEGLDTDVSEDESEDSPDGENDGEGLSDLGTVEVAGL